MTINETVNCFAYGDDKQRVLWRGRINRLISKGLIKPDFRYEPVFNSRYRLLGYTKVAIIDDEDVGYIDWLYNEASDETRRKILGTNYGISYETKITKLISPKDIEKLEKEMGL